MSAPVGIASVARPPSNNTGSNGAAVNNDGYYQLHHLTELPSSIKKFADKSFSLERIERALHSRMEQFTNRDCDRFRQLLKWIKSRASKATDVDSSILIIQRDSFSNILETLGVFATQEQAINLFYKYDVEQKGYLTLHELMCRVQNSKDSEFFIAGDKNAPRSDEMFANKGKRQFLRQKLTGESERPITPRHAVYINTITQVIKALREKLRINSPVTDTQTLPRSRRHLLRIFEQYDAECRGIIDGHLLIRVLNHVNFPIGVQHQKMLLEYYHVSTDEISFGFDYIKFIYDVFPETNQVATSLFLNHELGKEFFDNMSIEERKKRGLGPTREQILAAEREANTNNEKLEEVDEFYFETKSRQAQQFSRERAPPTPPKLLPLTALQSKVNIAGRTLASSYGNRPKTGAATSANTTGSLSANAKLSASQLSGSSTSRASNFNSTGTQSFSSSFSNHEEWKESSNGSASLNSSFTSSTSRPITGSSNALNPFTKTVEFIPAQAFLTAPRSADIWNSPRDKQSNHVVSSSSSAYSNYAPVTSQWTQLLAAPSPQRPPTGITFKTRRNIKTPNHTYSYTARQTSYSSNSRF